MPKKILFITDEKLLAILLEKKLTKEGYELSAARNGEDGLRRTKETMPDLILLDLELPGIDGFEVLKRIKADSVTQNIPVIVISNSGQAIELSQAKEFGASDWLIKTEFDPQALTEKVKEQMENAINSAYPSPVSSR